MSIEQNQTASIIESSTLFNSDGLFNPTINLDRKIKKPTKSAYGDRKLLRSKYYYTSGDTKNDKKIDTSDLLKYPEPHKFYLVKSILKNNERKQHRQNIKKSVIEGDTHRSQVNRRIRQRVHVEDGPDKIKTVVDTDPHFYTVVEGRPIKVICSIKDYVEELKYSGLSYLKSGYMRDEVLKIEKKIFEEQNIYAKNCENHNKYIDYFEQYLKENYDNSMVKINESIKVSKLLEEKTDEYNQLNIENGVLIRKLYKLEDEYKQAKVYEKFLYQLSPVDWQQKVELNAINKDENKSNESFKSIQNIIEKFKDPSNIEEPQIYFTNPSELMKILSNVKMQNLTNWSNSEKLIEACEKLNDNMAILTESIKQEFKIIEETMDELKRDIESEENKAKDLHNIIKNIIELCFREVVSSPDVLKLDVCVQDVYEKLIFQNISFETIKMMKTLEAEYEINMKKLDEISREAVLQVKYESYADDLRIMEEAKEAAKKLKKLEQLYWHLKRALESRI